MSVSQTKLAFSEALDAGGLFEACEGMVVKVLATKTILTYIIHLKAVLEVVRSTLAAGAGRGDCRRGGRGDWRNLKVEIPGECR